MIVNKLFFIRFEDGNYFKKFTKDGAVISVNTLFDAKKYPSFFKTKDIQILEEKGYSFTLVRAVVDYQPIKIINTY